MTRSKHVLVLALATSLAMGACGNKQAEEEAAAAAAAAAASEALLSDALSAARPAMAASATVADWDGQVLKEGSGAYTCMPTPPDLLAVSGTAPMCMDHEWMRWADAWVNRKEFTAGGLGISYMLAGDGGASNIDPYATAETPDNQWIVEGPHLMILVPDAALLEGLSTDPWNGGPYVMWKGTPYAHVMVPVNVPARGNDASKVADALSAANVAMAADAKVVDWDGTVLKDGSGAYACMPTPPDLLAVSGTAPMCMDHHWMAWADAWANRKAFTAGGLGISYMLAGDGGASNVDPYATAEAPDNEWVVEGPHLMIIVPDAAMLEGISTDPQNGGPYVMWKGTPYAHVMVPVGG